MVGLDVTTHAKSMEEACYVAKLHWNHANDLRPLMGHADQLNLDIDSIILLEVTGAQPLRECTDAGHLYWILLVAPRISSATFSAGLVNLEDLGNVAAIIKEHNSTYNKIM